MKSSFHRKITDEAALVVLFIYLFFASVVHIDKKKYYEIAFLSLMQNV